MDEKQWLELASDWRKAALDIGAKSEIGTIGWASAEMLLCCADMVVWKVREARGNLTLRM